MASRVFARVFLMGAVGSIFFLPSPRADEQRPVVAVFDVQTKFLKLSKDKQDMLTELLGQELGVGGVYQVMPPGDVKRALLEQSAESHKKCYDEKCLVELGKQLPANKLVTTTIVKLGGECRVAASLYDLKRQTTDLVAKEKVACDEVALAGAVERVAAKLRAFGVGGGAKSGFVEEDLGEKPAGEWDVSGGQEVIVAFSSEPPGAVVLVDGNLICQKTPCSKSVGEGKHVVSMQATRYTKRQEQLVVTSGTKVIWKLTPNYGWLTVVSNPLGKQVTLNGKEIGETPVERRELEPGLYRVLVKSQCHYDAGKKVRIRRGEEQKVSAELKQKQGAIAVKAKDQKGNDVVADVFVDGKKLGQTPGTFKVSVCSKELKVKSPEHGRFEKELFLKERKVSNVLAELQRSELKYSIYNCGISIKGLKAQLSAMEKWLKDHENEVDEKNTQIFGEEIRRGFSSYHKLQADLDELSKQAEGSDATASSKELEIKVNEIKEKIFRTKARILQLQETLLTGRLSKTFEKDSAEKRRKDCKNGDMIGCTTLGWYYYHGKGVNKNVRKAMFYYSEASNKGHTVGCNNVGWLFINGEGVGKDVKKGISILEKACADGGGSICSSVAALYYNGKLVSKDEEKAREYFRKACDNKHGKGCFNLALCYRHGQGVKKNEKVARKLFEKACALGTWDACKEIKKLESVK